MSGFTYSKYIEIANKTENLLKKLKKANRDDYNSSEAEDIGRRLISLGNSLIMYRRHSEK